MFWKCLRRQNEKRSIIRKTYLGLCHTIVRSSYTNADLYSGGQNRFHAIFQGWPKCSPPKNLCGPHVNFLIYYLAI